MPKLTIVTPNIKYVPLSDIPVAHIGRSRKTNFLVLRTHNGGVGLNNCSLGTYQPIEYYQDDYEDLGKLEVEAS